ncbi:hypothetical protein GE107_00005 [Cohnella sp. CFH 77786]|uniref:hypothetical protein n=1 Tax=Cohnella sp. CFH 77786 TaxID=2662265 RepID=UPI001C6087E9|nr:hypothetical protein [Cohnella sp. CFH 77786]MBW5444445.1 hypothetical protein [Cohnella sp. CFH 77786]
MDYLWKDIKIEGIARIEKCVAEFNIWELNLTPWAKFKIKIYEDTNGMFYGFTNLQLKSQFGQEGGVGQGSTIEQALQDTIKNFLKMLRERDQLTPEDFETVDPYDF